MSQHDYVLLCIFGDVDNERPLKSMIFLGDADFIHGYHHMMICMNFSKTDIYFHLFLLMILINCQQMDLTELFERSFARC